VEMSHGRRDAIKAINIDGLIVVGVPLKIEEFSRYIRHLALLGLGRRALGLVRHPPNALGFGRLGNAAHGGGVCGGVCGGA
jgi:hypothetical protein